MIIVRAGRFKHQFTKLNLIFLLEERNVEMTGSLGRTESAIADVLSSRKIVGLFTVKKPISFSQSRSQLCA
jgi:hypothetical protein